jgi:hypothetical protein
MSKCSPDQRSDIRGSEFHRKKGSPRVTALMRTTFAYD